MPSFQPKASTQRRALTPASKPKVVMTHRLDREVIRKFLVPHARVVIARDPKDLRKQLKDAQGLITLVRDPVDGSLLDHAPLLKVVGNYGVGVDNIDLSACRSRGIAVVNTPDVLTRATAELALALLLAAARRIPEGERLARSGKWTGWEPDQLIGLELKGRTAVLLGRGRIGRETARLFRAIGLHIEWITRDDSKEAIRQKLERAQILSLHAPLTRQTHHWLNRQRIAHLPSDCVVINTARGPLIDEIALTQALRTKQIHAAGLDVFEQEPRISKALRTLSNVVLLPHLGSATNDARRGMARLVVSGVLGILGGKHPPNQVQLAKRGPRQN